MPPASLGTTMRLDVRSSASKPGTVRTIHHAPPSCDPNPPYCCTRPVRVYPESGMPTESSILPLWAVAPLAMIAMIVIAGHLSAMFEAAKTEPGIIPASRIRIRAVNGALMLALCPLTAMLFGVIPPSDRQTFVMLSAVVVWLLGLVIVIAGIDMFNNARIAARERAKLREEISSARVRLEEIIRENNAARESESPDR